MCVLLICIGEPPTQYLVIYQVPVSDKYILYYNSDGLKKSKDYI